MTFGCLSIDEWKRKILISFFLLSFSSISFSHFFLNFIILFCTFFFSFSSRQTKYCNQTRRKENNYNQLQTKIKLYFLFVYSKNTLRVALFISFDSFKVWIQPVYHNNLFFIILSATAKKTTSNVTIIIFSYLALRSYCVIRSRDVLIKCSLRIYLSIVFDIWSDESAERKTKNWLFLTMFSFCFYIGLLMSAVHADQHLWAVAELEKLNLYFDLLLALSKT